MFPEAEVGAWQYFILLFSHSPKSNASVSKLVMSLPRGEVLSPIVGYTSNKQMDRGA